MSGFISVVIVSEEGQDGRRSKKDSPATYLFLNKMLNVDDIAEIADGRSLHDANMKRDFDTVYVTHKDGVVQEIDSTFALMEKGLFEVAAVAKVDPLANDAVNEPVDAAAASADTNTADAGNTVPGGGGTRGRRGGGHARTETVATT